MIFKNREDKKMKTGITELVFILDKSGSMAGFEGDTIGGYNAMLKNSKMNRVKQLLQCYF